ncbi:MAG TPA: aromatic-ring-hydroxylating dioxygenase subunit beta [Steroidobacteraceae bacterium]|nr:aromatic-ring-hydroxylating dioxygenase subunit beta [Steroidobacteraceae bacterium]
MAAQKVSRYDVEEFLYHEAELLDDWRLPEWSELYTDDARYDVASLDSEKPLEARSEESLFVLADDKERLTSRAKRLMKKTAHAEYPHSKVRHLISNVRVQPLENGELNVRANFVVYRTKEDRTTQYMGQAHYVLVSQNGQFKIKRKRCVLDLNSLADQGRLTIIL